MKHTHEHDPHSAEQFATETTGLPAAVDTQVIDVADGDTVELRIAPVVKQIGDSKVRMLAYNGSVPGPTLRVVEGSEVIVDVVNEGDLDGTVHWHGLRLDNRYDGTHETQAPIPVGGSFTYRVRFPDQGVYWYHPHIREDYGKELGLYGNILVVPADRDYWPAAHREVLLTLDDVLVEDGKIAPFSPTETTYAAMGRYGNVLLAGGETDLSLQAQAGEVVRFYLTNTANTRVFNVALPGARIKLVGGDSGRVEREQFVDSVVISPSERAVIDVIFERPGQLTLEHRTPERAYSLATIDVGAEAATPSLTEEFEVLRHNAEWVAERERLAPYFDAPPDKTLVLAAEMDMGEHEHAGHGEQHHHSHHGHQHGTAAGGIEWEDEMVDVNRMTTPANMRWKLVDRETGAVNHEIDWQFRVGDKVKIRLVNELDSDHPMHHPIHIHGAGRFVVLDRDGTSEEKLAWKDTVLVRTGETVDILLDVTNPGRWMVHCHISEHHESGMMFSFDVAPTNEGR
jgi:FtsP/CotA-like multicopper oxidase with cupredoxin domain